MLLQNLIKTLLTLLAGIVASLVAQSVLDSSLKGMVSKKSKNIDPDFEKRLSTIGKSLRNIINAGVFIATLVTLMPIWGIDIRPILTGAGIAGLAISFGSQALVKDMVTGFFILIENQFNTGDKVVVAGLEGTVIDIRLRSTVLRGTNGELHVIPNSQITTVTKLTSNSTGE